MKDLMAVMTPTTGHILYLALIRHDIEVSAHQVVLGLGHVGVVWAQFALVDVQSALVVLLHLLVFPLVLTQQSQVVQLLGHIRVVCAQNLRRENTLFQ